MVPLENLNGRKKEAGELCERRNSPTFITWSLVIYVARADTFLDSNIFFHEFAACKDVVSIRSFQLTQVAFEDGL